MYEIGQQVVCVNASKGQIIRTGEVYTIKSFALCECCGDLYINVGLKPIQNRTRCGKCNHISDNKGIAYFLASRFRPLDDLYNTEIEELMNEVNEKQPFEV